MRNESDFKLIDREVVEAYLRLPEGNRFFRGMISWLNFKETKIEFYPDERSHGESSWSFKQLYNYAKSIITSFSYAPLKLIRLLSYIMLIFAIVLGMQTLTRKLLGYAAEGFSTVIITQLMIGCIITFSLSCIASYIAKIYDELKNRPHYIILEEV